MQNICKIYEWYYEWYWTDNLNYQAIPIECRKIGK